MPTEEPARATRGLDIRLSRSTCKFGGGKSMERCTKGKHVPFVPNFTQSFADSKYVSEAKHMMKALDKMASDKIRIESASTLEIEKSPLSMKDKIHALEKLINNCKPYFQGYPAGSNNIQVKKIKDNSQIRLLNLLR